MTRLLLDGRYALVLRKGGIAEDDGPGRFRLEHERFALFPAWEHERRDWLKPAARRHLPAEQPAEAPGETPRGESPTSVELHGHAEVGRIWQVPSREAFDRLDAHHPWLPPQIDMRFSYKPSRPLYLVALRCHRWPRPHPLPCRDAYAGCRSWVPLVTADTVPAATLAGSEPAMDEAAFASLLDAVDAALA